MPRQVSRLPIRTDVLKAAIRTAGLGHQAIVDLAEDAGIDVGISTLRGALSDAKAAPNTIRAFAVVLNLHPNSFVVDAEAHSEVLDSISRALPNRSRERIHGQGRILRPKDPMHCVQDKKNLIKDPKLSRSLIKGMGVPSLFDAVYNSATFTPIDDQHKDEPFVRGMAYNHFLMIGAVLVINRLDAKKKKTQTAIGYHRSVSHLKGTYKHTQGLSILWATGFEFNLKETMDRDMWNWMKLAADTPGQAEDAFTGKQDPSLLRLFSHKLKLNPAICSIAPLCVVTNDQRSKTRKRVYTQYVFKIEVTPKGKPRPIDQLMAEYIHEPDQPAAVDYSPHVSDQFINHHGEPNRMDVAVWQQLHKCKNKEAPKGISLGNFVIN